MKSIAIDFKNQTICFMTEGQQGTEYLQDVSKDILFPFIPEAYRTEDSFTWDFEDGMFSVNRRISLSKGAIMTEDSFVPAKIMPMPSLKSRYSEFISLIGYEEINTMDMIKELPEEVWRLLGFDKEE